MIDHVSVAVSDLLRAAAFYDRLLAPLGLTRFVERERAIGFGKRYPEFWLNLREDMAPVPDDVGAHICLRAPTKDAVDAFHAAALAEGGRCDGPPGDRQATLGPYYGAFVRDPDGNKIEAVNFAKPD